MMKNTRKLVLRSQTIRVLAQIDLVRIVGGADSGNVQCLVIPNSGPKACSTVPPGIVADQLTEP